MIKITKDYTKIPEGLTSERAEEKRKALLREGNKHEFANSYYAHKTVKNALKKIYNNKCGYCESKDGASSALQVDHYRPKKEVKDTGHTGYYWLAYEWTNLIYSCAKCNRSKSSHFPLHIEGSRVKKLQSDQGEWPANSNTFKNEKPLLINPEIDNPDEHLEFTRDGDVREKAGSPMGMGQKSIYVYGLQREDLRLARKGLVDRFNNFIRDQLKIIYDKLKKGELQNKKTFDLVLELGFKTTIKNIRALSVPENEYSRLGWYMHHSFKGFFIDTLETDEFKKIVALAFARYV